MNPLRTSHSQSVERQAQPGILRLGSLIGFSINVHWSWLIAFLLFTWAIQAGIVPAANPDWTDAQRWLISGAVSVLFFGSVLAHELAHAAEARRRGYGVRDVTLFLFGGASSLEEEPRTAKDEFWISVVGPLASFGVALAFGTIWVISAGLAVETVTPIAFYLAAVNLVLGGFNLLPGYPLDGGRVLRALVWGARRNVLQATKVASIGGQFIAGALIAWGLVSLFNDSLTGGLWSVLIGWYLWSAAGGEYRQFVLRRSLTGLTVDAVLDRNVPRVAPDVTIQQLATERILGHNERAFFVAATQDGDVLGLVTLVDVARVPRSEWPSVSVYRAMTPRDRLLSVNSGSDVTDALRIMAQHNVQQLPVFHGRDALGLVSQTGIAQAIQLRSAVRPLEEAA